MHRSRLGMVASVLGVLGLFLFSAAADNGGDAVISLGVSPLPPDCVENPGGTATITWLIQHQTVPDYVTYTLYDPTHTIVYDQETYPGVTGISVTREWMVPSILPDGVYWAKVEYYAQGIGLEAWAETGFLVCEPEYKVCCLEHECIITTRFECETLSGFWHPEWTTCEPNPCDIYTPTDESTWGRIKGLYR